MSRLSCLSLLAPWRAALALTLATPVSPSQSFEWTRAPLVLPATRGSFAAYDAVRSRLVLVPQEPLLHGGPWEWDGTRWAEHAPAGANPDQVVGATFDSARGQLQVLELANNRQLLRIQVWTGRQWIPQAQTFAPPPRTSGAFAFDPVRARTVLFGGEPTNGPMLYDTWEWDGTGWTAVPTPSAPFPRYGAGMAFDPVNNVLVLAGGHGPGGGSAFADTWTYDGITWTRRADLPAPRMDHAMVTDQNASRIVVFGGYDALSNPTDRTTLEWNGASWTPLSTNNAPRPVARAGAAFDPYAGVTLIGGTDGGWVGEPPIPQEWTLGATVRDWSRRGGADGPRPGQAPAALVADRHRGELLLFSSTSSQVAGGVNEFSRWDGAHWAAIPGTLPIPTRYGAVMAYHDARREVVLFGGQDGAGLRADTWIWNGMAWTAGPVVPRPSTSYGPALVPDDRRGVVVLVLPGDLWEWDGATWRQPMTWSRPVVVANLAAAFDRRLGRTVRYGTNGNSLLPEIWLWDGTAWSQVPMPIGPDMKYGCRMTYDERRGTCLLVGINRGTLACEAWDVDVMARSWRQLATLPVAIAMSDFGLAYDHTRGHAVLWGGRLDEPINARAHAGTWLLAPADLAPASQGVPPGSAIQWSLHRPADAGALFVCGLSLDATPGIPSRLSPLGAPEVWPLRADRLFALSLGFPSLLGALDGAGRAGVTLPLPGDAGLVGLDVPGSALLFDRQLAVLGATRGGRAFIVP